MTRKNRSQSASVAEMCRLFSYMRDWIITGLLLISILIEVEQVLYHAQQDRGFFTRRRSLLIVNATAVQPPVLQHSDSADDFGGIAVLLAVALEVALEPLQFLLN